MTIGLFPRNGRSNSKPCALDTDAAPRRRAVGGTGVLGWDP